MEAHLSLAIVSHGLSYIFQLTLIHFSYESGLVHGERRHACVKRQSLQHRTFNNVFIIKYYNLQSDLDSLGKLDDKSRLANHAACHRPPIQWSQICKGM